MYLNRITLIGFLGSDADIHTANNSTFAQLSLATKSSYKDKKTGEYVSHTEWHRAIVWGKLADYAKTLTKGAHLQIEGELRSREYADKKNNDAKRRVWEIRGRFHPKAGSRGESFRRRCGHGSCARGSALLGALLSAWRCAGGRHT
jgi:single-strand DNA-binding protein